MNVFVILAHHERRSFNGALFHVAVATLTEAGHTVVTSDLIACRSTPSPIAATSCR